MECKVTILGAATGYSPEKVKIFIQSLYSVGFTGRLVLFLNSHQIRDYEKFFNQNYGFEIHYEISKIGIFLANKRIHNDLKKIIKKSSTFLVWGSKKIKKPFIYYFAYPHVSRFFDYKNYLEKANDISSVILTDTRDVIFQKNPDNFFNIDTLYLGMEDKRNPIGKDSFHIKWITDVYGVEYLNTISNEQISCAGVTIGDFTSVNKYLDTMLKEFLDLPYYLMVKSNYDQGIHNKLLYSNSFNNVTLCQPLESLIATLGTIPQEEISINSDGEILNKDGNPSPIVHQYDRHQDLNDLIISRFN